MTSATLSQEWRSAASGEAGNNSWLRKVSAVFLAAVLAIVGALGAPTKAFAIEGDYNETFTAYQDRNFFGEPSKFGPLFVQDYDKGMDTNGAEVVFCFNHSRAQPQDASDYNGLYPKPKYTRLASEGRLDDFLDRPSVHGQIEKHVIDVVYNYERVGQYYGLSDLDKNNIAQLAIWYFTDNKQSDVAQWGANPYAAYKTLIGQEVADGPGLKTAPDNITLDIFESTTEFSGKRYQNLLSTTTRDKTTREEVPGSEGEEEKEASITTFAHGAKKEDKSLSEQGGTITDIVTYSGLEAGKEYKMEGQLFVRDENGKESGSVGEIETVNFTPEASDGTVEVKFEVSAEDAKKLAGKHVVAFETLWGTSDNNKIIAKHTDINDEDQSVLIEKKKEETPKEDDKEEGEIGSGGEIGSSVGSSDSSEAIGSFAGGVAIGSLAGGLLGSSEKEKNEGTPKENYSGDNKDGDKGGEKTEKTEKTETNRGGEKSEKTEGNRGGEKVTGQVEKENYASQKGGAEEGQKTDSSQTQAAQKHEAAQKKEGEVKFLANTGANVTGVAIAALVLIAIGGVIIVRRRKS